MHRKLIGPLAQLREAALRSQSKCERKLYSAIESGRLFGGKEAALDAAQERFVACCLADGANWAALRGLQGNLLALLAERDTELRASCSKAVSDAATTGYKPGDRLPKIVRALVHDALADSKALLDARVDFDSQDMTTRGLVAAAARAASLAGLDVGVDDDDDGEDVNIVHASFYDSPEAVAAVMNQQVAALTRLQDPPTMHQVRAVPVRVCVGRLYAVEKHPPPSRFSQRVGVRMDCRHRQSTGLGGGRTLSISAGRRAWIRMDIFHCFCGRSSIRISASGYPYSGYNPYWWSAHGWAVTLRSSPPSTDRGTA